MGPPGGRHLAAQGADLLVVLNGSPFEVDKPGQRLEQAGPRVAETGLPLIYVNQVGGQDELVFDGASFVLAADGAVVATLPAWDEAVRVTTWKRRHEQRTRLALCADAAAATVTETESIYRALVTGLRDYVTKNGFPGRHSGPVGRHRQRAVGGAGGRRPGAGAGLVRHDALALYLGDSLTDAEAAARLLGVRYDTIDIGPAMTAFDDMLAPVFQGRPADVTEENIQSRARGIIVMALSNKFGPMVLSTGNKSEMSVGYATLYGDMAGGFAILKDVYKTTVTRLSQWRNTHGRPPGLSGPDGPVMPERIISKPPSAELRPDQTDEDSLPPYAVLDRVLNGLIEGDQGVSDLIAAGHDAETVHRIWRLLNGAEYKRRQAPPGVKITLRAFGRDRRYPMTNRFRGVATIPRFVVVCNQTFTGLSHGSLCP